MKKYLIILALLASMPLFAERVDPETARKVATTFLSNNGAKASQLTDLSKSAGFPNLYIFNGEEGFVVMAADDCVKPILGYSLTGKFVTEDMPENLVWWLQGYNDQIQDVINRTLPFDTSAKTEWQKLKTGVLSEKAEDNVVTPLISTLWDQIYPYNYYCPEDSNVPSYCEGHVYTGCVATAMAQIMKYWNYPIQGHGVHSYTPEDHPEYGVQVANFDTTNYDWDNMPISPSDNQTEITAVATLMFHCGVAVDMNYGPAGSGAWSGNVPNALIDYFGYSPSTTYVSRDGYEDRQWIEFLKGELDEARPLFYSGSNTNSGHAFICDGYRSDNYFHFNWGWSGSDGTYGNAHGNNGYWQIGSLSPGVGGSGSGSGTYNLGNAVIAWAEPISSLTAPTISASITNNVVTLTWNAVADATSYDVYKGNTKIASNITSLSYIDENVSFGHYYDYYLRADSLGKKSNPSNAVTIVDTYQNRIPQSLNANTTVSDNSVILTWNEPQSLSMDLHYGIGNLNASYGSGKDEGTHWGQCYPSQSLNDFAGMAIDHVSIYLGYSGNYSVDLYKDAVASEANLLANKSFNTSGKGWYDVIFDNAIPLDITHDLWVVFYTSKSIKSPAFYDYYYGNNKEQAHYLWENFNDDNTYTWYTENISWPIKIHLTDGVFTYNVYRDNVLVAEHHPNNSYNDESLSDGTHEYLVKTFANNWESNASNIISVPYSTTHRISDAAIISDNLMLSDHNRYIIESTGKLTVGTLNNDDPANLILEDGAQLINDNTGVKATVKKTIEGFGNADNKGNWYFFASPLTEQFNIANQTNLIAANDSDYDLYVFDQSSNSEWLNYKNDHFTTIDHAKGYLYAHKNDIDIAFAGTLNNTEGSVPISYTREKPYSGYNLVGNPFPCNATIDRDFYRIVETNEGSKILLATDNTIAPMEGIIVKAADGDDKNVTFSKPASQKGNLPGNMITMSASHDGVLDNARIRFDGNLEMEKLTLHESGTELFIVKDGKEYTMVVNDHQNEISIGFRAANNGTYTLNFEIEDIDLDYLHLFDNITGTDIDLLSTPSYSFEARINDFTSRFRLMFNDIEDDPNEPSDLTEGDIQILDVTGRIVGTYKGHMQNVPTEGMSSGVYILRTINGNDIQNKKIIIK